MRREPDDDRDEPTDDEISAAGEEFSTWDFSNAMAELTSLDTDAELLKWARGLRERFDDYLSDVVADRESDRSDGDE